jgi:hypothetical protein
MWFKMRIKPFNTVQNGITNHVIQKCHSRAWGSKCEYFMGLIQTLNMSSASLSLLLSAELNHSIVRQGSKCHYKACDSKWHFGACGSKSELNHSIVFKMAL